MNFILVLVIIIICSFLLELYICKIPFEKIFTYIGTYEFVISGILTSYIFNHYGFEIIIPKLFIIAIMYILGFLMVKNSSFYLFNEFGSRLIQYFSNKKIEINFYENKYHDEFSNQIRLKHSYDIKNEYYNIGIFLPTNLCLLNLALIGSINHNENLCYILLYFVAFILLGNMINIYYKISQFCKLQNSKIVNKKPKVAKKPIEESSNFEEIKKNLDIIKYYLSSSYSNFEQSKKSYFELVGKNCSKKVFFAKYTTDINDITKEYDFIVKAYNFLKDYRLKELKLEFEIPNEFSESTIEEFISICRNIAKDPKGLFPYSPKYESLTFKIFSDIKTFYVKSANKHLPFPYLCDNKDPKVYIFKFKYSPDVDPLSFDCQNNSYFKSVTGFNLKEFKDIPSKSEFVITVTKEEPEDEYKDKLNKRKKKIRL
jgi:hypothetical protein